MPLSLGAASYRWAGRRYAPLVTPPSGNGRGRYLPLTRHRIGSRTTSVVSARRVEVPDGRAHTAHRTNRSGPLHRLEGRGRSRHFYSEVLGGKVVFSGDVTYVALANSWIIINVGGGPTDDKPSVTLEVPQDPDRVSSFLNIRVADIHAVYAEWSAKGADFLTPPNSTNTRSGATSVIPTVI